MRLLVGISLVLSLLACDSSSDDASTSVQGSGVFQNLKYLLLDAGDLNRSETSLQGSGKLAFETPLAGAASKDNFAMSFTLEDGGSLSLISHADTALENGLNIIFSRDAERLNVSLARGSERSEAKQLEGVEGSGSIQLAVDVHNDESPAHILIWSADATSYGEDSALFNSEEDGEAPGQGVSSQWGLSLSRAQISSLKLEAARFNDE